VSEGTLRSARERQARALVEETTLAEKSQQSATWIGTVAGVVGTLVTIQTAYKIGTDSIPVSWPLLSLAQSITILALGVYIFRRRRIHIAPKTRPRSRELFASLVGLISRDFENQLSGLAHARVTLYGRQVRAAQIHLLSALKAQSGRELRLVRATDIIRDLGLWPTRGAYLAANREFLQAKATAITRIFLLHSDLLTGPADVQRMLEIAKMHEAMGVTVRMHLVDLLSAEYIEDFVLYRNDAVLVEAEQGDVDFLRGKVVVYFDAQSIDKYGACFDYLEANNDTKSAAEVYSEFKRVFSAGAEGQAAPVPFSEQKARFLNACR
jgi:hypothetical protein